GNVIVAVGTVVSTLYVAIEAAQAPFPIVAVHVFAPVVVTVIHMGSSTIELFVPASVDAVQAVAAVGVFTEAIAATTSSISCVDTPDVTVSVVELPLRMPVWSSGVPVISPLK